MPTTATAGTEAGTMPARTGLQNIGEAFEAGNMADLIEQMVRTPGRMDSGVSAEEDEASEEAIAPGPGPGKDNETVVPPEESEEGEEEESGAGEEPKAAAPEEEPKEGDPDALPPEMQRAFDKRIGREVAKTKALKEELAEVRAKLEAMQVEKPAEPKERAGAAFKPGETEELRGLRTRIAERTTLREWCAENAEGGEIVGPDGKTRYYEAKDVARIHGRLQDELLDLRSEEKLIVREQALEHRQQEAHFNAQADAEFPWLKDKASEEHAMFTQVVGGLPELKRLPNWRFIAAVHVLGVQALQQRQAAKQGAAGKPKVKPQQIPTGQPAKPAANGVEQRRTRGEDKNAASLNRFKANPGDPEALTEALSRQRAW